MRNEQHMLDLILSTARDDERIRTVMMNGSRANPNAPRDPFQDFDIVYFVTDFDFFTNNMAWADRFGERMIYQLPEENLNGAFAYLLQFTDGNRIDLTIAPVERAPAWLEDYDTQTIILLDKDGLFPPLPLASDASYIPKKPTEKEFYDCCNEFWWVSPYVAKGLWRGEITYAKHNFDVYIRDELMKMLAWYVGEVTGYAAGPGKDGKYLRKYLSPDRWQCLLHTYAGAGEDETWEAWAVMANLFEEVAKELAAKWGYEVVYPQADAHRVHAHMAHVRELPHDATKIY